MFPPTEYLSKVKPFSLLQKAELADLVRRMEVEFYKEGKTVFRRGKNQERVFLVREGKFGLFSGERLVDTIEKDELLGIEALNTGWRPEFDGKALEDSVVFEFETAAVKRMLERNVKFRGYIECLNSNRFLQLMGTSLGGNEENLHKTVGTIVGRSPVFCSKEETLANAVKLMVDQRVGSVIVVNPKMEPIGIVTHSDVLRHLSTGAGVLDPVERAMSSPIITVSSSSSVLDAYVKFISYGINHLAIVQNGKLAGVISIKDLVSSLEVHSYFFKVTKGASGAIAEESIATPNDMDEIIRNAAKHGLDYPSISAIVARLADSAVKRAFHSLYGTPGKSTALVFTGELGRGEISFPLQADLLLIGCNQAEGLQEALSRRGFKARKALCCDADMHGFLSELQSEGLLELMDARHILGDNHTWMSFKKALMERIVQGELVEKATIFTGSSNEANVLIREIANAVKILAFRCGETMPKSTWERLEALGTQGCVPQEMAGSLREAYIALRTIDLRGRVCNDEKRLDKNLHKKVIKTAFEQAKCLKGAIVEDDRG